MRHARPPDPTQTNALARIARLLEANRVERLAATKGERAVQPTKPGTPAESTTANQ